MMMVSKVVDHAIVSHDVVVLWEAESEDGDPDSRSLELWATKALEHQQATACEVAIKVVCEAEMRELNREYRSKDAPTNVLSFPLDGGQPTPLLLLGDIALCASVIRTEARAQDKSIDSHYAHMVVHGVLHLLGFDHIEAQEAEEMEQIERDILRTMGIDDPYEVGISS